MLKLKKIIEDRLAQLEDRKFMIPRYINRPGAFLGKKDFSMDDIPKIEAEIEECKICLNALTDLKNKINATGTITTASPGK